MRFFQLITLFSFLIVVQVSVAQDFPYVSVDYDFIQKDKNVLLNTDNDLGLKQFYAKWADLIRRGNKKIEILHLGDSHVQADFLTGRIRDRMQQFFPGSEGARGLIFPYNLAETNNPGNYQINSNNNWEVINGVKQDNFSTGIIPAKVVCGDSVIKLSVNQNDNLQYSGFDQVELWYACAKEITILKPAYAEVELLNGYGRVLINLNGLEKETEIEIFGASEESKFELYGIGLHNSLPGITYHALGLNGATTEDFVKCEHFERYLSYVQPDLIIVSLGTNDMYDLNVRMKKFTLVYSEFLQKIRNVFPNKALILTTPGDHFIYSYLPNSKLSEASEIIKKLAVKFDAAVWDFYHIMGGYRSMMGWDMNGLSSKDRIHFTRKGYYLQADLFFNAILKNFEKLYLNNHYYKQKDSLGTKN